MLSPGPPACQIVEDGLAFFFLVSHASIRTGRIRRSFGRRKVIADLGDDRTADLFNRVSLEINSLILI